MTGGEGVDVFLGNLVNCDDRLLFCTQCPNEFWPGLSENQRVNDCWRFLPGLRISRLNS